MQLVSINGHSSLVETFLISISRGNKIAGIGIKMFPFIKL